MAERKNPSKGGKPDKIFRDALMLEVKREWLASDGQKTSKINAIAAKLVDRAIEGNEAAAQMVRDSLDGKPTQQLDVVHEGEITHKSAPVSALDDLIAEAFSTRAGGAGKDSLPN